MNNLGWKVQVIDLPGTLQKDIFIFKEAMSGTAFLSSDFDTVKTISEGEVPTPTFRVSDFILHALVDELTKKGYRPSHESNIAGKLERTDAHLQDLRFLLKIGKNADQDTQTL